MERVYRDRRDFDRKLEVLKQRVDRLYQCALADSGQPAQERPECSEAVPSRRDEQNGATPTQRSPHDIPSSVPPWLENLVQHLPAGVAWLDKDYHLMLANAAARCYFAVLTTATVGERITVLGDQPIERLVTPRTDGLPDEVVLAGPPRRVFAIRAHALPEDAIGGGWVLLIQDVTGERDLQRQRAQQERQVAIEQLIGGVAYEFNTFLCIVIGYAELLQERPELPQAVKDDLAVMAKRGWRSTHLVRQLLDFSGQPMIECQPLDLLPIFEEITSLLRNTLPPSIRVVLHSAPDMYRLNADGTSIRQLLANLTVNAREAMPNGGALRFGLSHLTLCPGDSRPCLDMPDGRWVVVTISDTGMGMPPQVREHIFEAFFTTKADGHVGLGLAQVYGIMKQHNGYITVHSEPGQGATFTLYFPSLDVPADAFEEALPPELLRGLGETVLLVDNDPVIREALRLTLQYLQYRVLTAANGQEALVMYQHHGNATALVLMAVAPMESDGLALLQALQQRAPGLKVIVLADDAQPTPRHNLLPQGVVACLHKPPDLAMLAQAIRRALESWD